MFLPGRDFGRMAKTLYKQIQIICFRQTVIFGRLLQHVLQKHKLFDPTLTVPIYACEDGKRQRPDGWHETLVRLTSLSCNAISTMGFQHGPIMLGWQTGRPKNQTF
jgi:hypothetical protein